MMPARRRFIVRGEKNFGVDFRGGDLITLSSPQPVPSTTCVRRWTDALGLTTLRSSNRSRPAKSYITIRSAVEHQREDRSTAWPKPLPHAQLKVERSERVGALVGGELARTSLWALGLGMLGILIYVTFRFEFSFAIGAIVALLHDVLITVGIFSLLGREFTLTMVGALLTIAGYSINDTIVVFDRIREGLASGERGSIEHIMNESINQTLSRTILTGSVTFDSDPLPVLLRRRGSARFRLGHHRRRGLVGTYSSIFIASPIVLWWTRMRGGSGASSGVKSRKSPQLQQAQSVPSHNSFAARGVLV